MGIPYYFYVITKTYDGILTDIIPECDNFMFDFNGLIHPSSQKYLKAPAKDLEKGLLTAIWNDTKDFIKLVKPKKTVHIYIDGVAPIAKMNQQRKRRFHKKFIEGANALSSHSEVGSANALSSHSEVGSANALSSHSEVGSANALSSHSEVGANALSSHSEVSAWDSNAISPGTTFMTRLHASIRAHIRYSKDDFVYYFSSSDEVGEGEHKLFANIVQGETTVIYGMDADLIMLALFSHTKNIYLLREGGECLNIDNLRKGILNDLKNKYNWSITKEALIDSYHPSAKQVIESYGVVCFFLGNDFLPHPVSISLKKGGLEDILTEAGKLEGFIVNEESHIEWSAVNSLLSYLGTNENTKIFDIVSQHYNKKKEVESDPFEHDILFRIDRKKWRTHYYKELFYSDTGVILNSCDLYLKGLLWTFLYYKRKPKDNMWYYPYNYAPTMTDVHNCLNSKISCYETLEKEWKEKYPKDIFCEPIVQLLSILPRESIDCLPVKYRKAMENPLLDYLYPKTYKIQTFMKTHLWECSQVLPPMNIHLCKSVIMSEPKTSS